MAVGDRIGSARTAGIMRRINALEHASLISYSFVAHIASGFTAPAMNFASLIVTDGTYLYTSEDDGTTAHHIKVYKYNTSGTPVATFLDTTDLDQGINTPTGIAYGGGLMWVGCQVSSLSTFRIRAFNTSGTNTATKEYTSTNYAIVLCADSEGAVYVNTAEVFGVDASLRKINSAGVEVWVVTDFDDGYRIDATLYGEYLLVHGFISPNYVVRKYSLGGDFIGSYDTSAGSVNQSYRMFYDTFGVLNFFSWTYPPSVSPPEQRFKNENINVVGTGISHGTHGVCLIDNDFYWRETLGLSTTAQTQNITNWSRYPTPGTDTGQASLGTSDQGQSIPTDTSLAIYRPHYFELRDMRAVIEAVAVQYENPATAAPYTITAGVNNIFRLGIDSGQDDWTTATVTHGSRIREDYYNDIDLVLTQLEGSALV